MSDDQVQEIKDRVDIVNLVSQYVPLKKAGANHKGLCPFHKERTPSFMVNPERQIFKCFGCNESGDVLTFIQKIEGLTFPEALELLADRAGVRLDRRKAPEQYRQERDEKTTLFRISAAAAKFFHHLLAKHPVGEPARQYLRARKVTDDTIVAFQLGYAPVTSALGQWLGRLGFRPGDLRSAGSPERFHDRIMFPIRDTLGNVVGFTGRLLEPTGARSKPSTRAQAEGEQGVGGGAPPPKYFNTPETPIFRKGKLVYGLFEGKQEIRSRQAAILVEGQMDVVLSHQAGVRIAVASSGTALTVDHLAVIRRYAGSVLLAFDADDAGVAATIKTIGLAFDADLSAKVIPMPAGFKDVGEIVERDPAQWGTAIAEAVPALDWLIDRSLGKVLPPLDGAKKKQVAASVLPVLIRIQDPIEQAHYVTELATRLQVPQATIVAALNRVRQRRSAPRSGQVTPSAPRAAAPEARPLAEQLAGLLALHPKLTDKLQLEPSLFPAGSRAERLLHAVQTWYTQHQADQNEPSPTGEIRRALRPDDQTAFDVLILETQELITSQEPLALAQELSVRLRRDQHESIKADIAAKIREAERGGDRTAVKRLMVELQAALKA